MLFDQINKLDCYYVDDVQQLNEWPLSTLTAIEKADPGEAAIVDTEFIRRSTYRPEFCLLQLQFNGMIVCIDALNTALIEAIKPLLANRVLVCHSSRQELEIFHDIGLSTPQIFDTQIAAELCGYDEQISYARLVEEICGVELEKTQALSDWKKRPLTQKQLCYAAADVAYLKTVYEHLYEKLNEQGRMDWLDQETQPIIRLADPFSDMSQSYKKLGKASEHSFAVQQRVKAVAIWREHLAAMRDIAKTWLISDQDVLDMCIKSEGIKLTEKRATDLSDLKKDRAFKLGRLQPLQLEQLLSLLNSDYEDEGVWPAFEPITPEQKQAMSQLSSSIKATAKKMNIAATRMATRADVEKWVRYQRGRLSHGWRAEIMRELR